MSNHRILGPGYVVLWLLLVVGLVPTASRAQTFGVAVSPAEITITVPGGSRQTQRFWVKNTGTAGQRHYVVMGPSCNYPVVDCVWSRYSLDIPQGDSGSIDVSFTAGPNGTTGNTHFDAVVNDQQSVTARGVVFVQAASTPPPDGITVTPNSGTENVPPYAQAQQKTFTVKNTSGRTIDVSIQGADCQPFDMLCAFSTQSISGLAQGAEAPVTVTFTSGAPGWSGTIALTAKINDNQSVSAGASVTVQAPSQAWLETKSLNPGTSVTRAACVSFPVGTNAAYECGDLTVAHAMPSLRVRGDDRTPILRYASTHGTPTPVVAANVSAPAGGATNVSAWMTVRRGGADMEVVAPTAFGDIAGGTTRRIALAYDASSDTTGIYPYTLRVAMTVGGVTDTLTSSDSLVVVNRRNSAFGGGWWLAGYERLVPIPGGNFLWVGGDGSTRLYVRDTTSMAEVYRAPGFDRPDSLVRDDQLYVRHLRHRAHVKFTLDGRHVATVDPLGITTTFQHDGSGRLEKIIHPTTAAPFHQFFYHPTTGRIDSVTGPGPVGGTRRVRFNVVGGAILNIYDADDEEISFGYNTSGYDMLSRASRNRFITSFTLASHRLIKSTIPLAPPSQSSVITICPAEIRGIKEGGCDDGSVAVDSAVTTIDGPRTDAADVSRVKVDRFGAPTVVMNPLSHITRLFRGNRDFVGLVTRVVQKNGWTNDIRYDARGLPAARVEYGPLGPGADAVTSYTWDAQWERVTSVTLPEQNTVRFGYDPTTGNRVWQEGDRPGNDTTFFRYYGDGAANERLLRAVDAPADAAGYRAVDTLAYDALGNLAESREGHQGTPLTIPRVTTWLNDAVGRPIRVATNINTSGTQQQRDTTGYDVMDRVVHTRSYAIGTFPLQEFVQTTRVYDDEGNLRRLDRSASPPASGTPVNTLVSRWGYDQANRMVADTATDGRVETHLYDAAGNDTVVTTRRNHPIRMSYDALNRMVTRVLPKVDYQKTSVGIAAFKPNTFAENVPYPRRPIAPGVTAVPDTEIGGMTESFSYDEMGNLLTANNADAQVQRTYFANSQPKSETLRIRTYAGNDFTAHTYLTEYEYDLNGRRTLVKYPQQVSPGATPGTAQYRYSQTTGVLETVIDPLGATFTLHTDLRGQLDTLYLPGGIREDFGYDAAGRVLSNRMHTSGGTALRLTSREYDARDKMLASTNTTGAKDTHTAKYTGLGYVAKTTYGDHGVNPYGGAVAYTSVDTLVHDGLGNVFTGQTITTGSSSANYNRFDAGPRFYRYDPVTGRLRAMTSTFRSDTVRYDSAGNARLTHYPGSVPNGMDDDRAVYYDALNQVRAVDHRIANGASGTSSMVFTFEEFRYDALGRRVLGRTRRACRNILSVDCVAETIRRTIWSGAQELAEIQMPGADTVSAATLENDTQPVSSRIGTYDDQLGGYKHRNPFFGRVAYTHGVGLDRPLSVVRLDYADSIPGQPFVRWVPFSLVPHWNLRDEADNGSFADGSLSKCTGGAGTPCVQVRWPFGWTATMQQAFVRDLWHGSLIESKRDGSGLLFRRNRYIDPATGRFTQEDPIGFAGGLNLYGFAGGDPVNYSDPFGLCYGPLSTICARVAVFFLGRVFPAVAEWTGALSGLSAGASAASGVRYAEAGGPAAKTISRWTATFEGNIDRLDDMHIDAAVRELAGEVVHWSTAKNRASDHITEVRGAMGGMRNVAGAMKRLLEKGQLTEDQRQAAQALRQRAIDALQRARDAGVTPR
jgi:RHS repeat-associated protein